MYSIIAIITLIIILIEFYTSIRISKKTIIYKSTRVNGLDGENFLPVKYNEYSVKGDKIINHSAGQILLKENFNFFIKEKNKMYLAKKNKIYKINSEFTIEILDVNGKDTIYYYIKSH